MPDWLPPGVTRCRERSDRSSRPRRRPADTLKPPAHLEARSAPFSRDGSDVARLDMLLQAFPRRAARVRFAVTCEGKQRALHRQVLNLRNPSEALEKYSALPWPKA